MSTQTILNPITGNTLAKVGSDDTLDLYVSALKVTGTELTATVAELNTLDGITAAVAELNILDGVTATAAQLNFNVVTAGTSAASKAVVLGSDSKISALDITSLKIGGTSVTSTAAELNILDNCTATAAELNTAADISVNGALVRMAKIHVAAGDITTEKDSTWDLPAKSIVYDVFIDVTTAQGGKTVSIGTKAGEAGGDADGFAVDISLNGTGLVRPEATVTTGTFETYFSACTRGVLLSDYLAGSDIAGDFGVYRSKPYLSTAATAKSLVYTGSGGTTTAVFDIYVMYVELG